jgi:tRNA nucleotidyltransferase (CCA-adding enzyme)
MQELPAVITYELRLLRAAFVERGYDLRLVGGCVRDLLRGEQPKDIDLCTDADPDVQQAIYLALGLSYYLTGLKHGTITVKMFGEETYEVTSLRTESNHDGRHADVQYTRDWLADLGRRDLTINAMALTMDGKLIDPFKGAADLKAGRVRFVGVAADRIQEDYLRILRWLRFHARYADSLALDEAASDAVREHGGGLRGISRERVWSEVAKIVSGPGGPGMLAHMYFLDLLDPIGLISGDIQTMSQVWRHTRNPVTLMTAYAGMSVEALGESWRWSTAERQLSKFLREHHRREATLDCLKYMLAHERAPTEHVREFALTQGRIEEAAVISLWDVPSFPVSGEDLIKVGACKPGPQMGTVLRNLRAAWADADYSLTKADLLTLECAP